MLRLYGSQLVIRTHNETFSVVSMRVNIPDCSPVRVDSGDTSPTPSGFAEIVSNNFPVLHRQAAFY
jgi:hypothetical protein